jgi:signal transduction histidine kinase
MRTLVFFLIVLIVSLTSQSSKGGQSARQESTDPSITRYVQQGNEAISLLQTRLVQALTSELNKGGPASAVRVCRDEAQVITKQVAQEKGIAVGRTSHRLRNPVNVPRDWIASFVEESVGKRASEVEAQVVDLGNRVGVLKPIGVLELCTNCHGMENQIAGDVKAVLAEAYPDDMAVDFKVGDLRGWMWAEVPKE